MPGLNDDLTRAVAESAAGGALRVTDISGIGQSTANDLRGRGFRSTQDIKSASVDDLTDVPGVGEKTARNAIKEAGGDPRQNRRSNTGSVSAAGIGVPVGDFRVDFADKDKADAFHTNRFRRSQNARNADKGNRAPVTTDLDEWKSNPGELDFPGVDTPTENPEVMEKDRRFISVDDLIGSVEDDFF